MLGLKLKKGTSFDNRGNRSWISLAVGELTLAGTKSPLDSDCPEYFLVNVNALVGGSFAVSTSWS